MLQQKFDTDTEFMIVSTSEYLKIAHEYSYEENIDNFINKFCEREKAGTLMCTLGVFDLDIDDNNITRISQVVVMEEYVLIKLVVKYITKLDELRDFLIQGLTHEMGHVICNIESYDGRPLNEAYERKFHEHDRQNEAIKNIEDIDNYDAYYLAYNNTPEEIKANNRVGLIPEEMLKVEKKLYD